MCSRDILNWNVNESCLSKGDAKFLVFTSKKLASALKHNFSNISPNIVWLRVWHTCFRFLHVEVIFVPYFVHLWWAVIKKSNIITFTTCGGKSKRYPEEYKIIIIIHFSNLNAISKPRWKQKKYLLRLQSTLHYNRLRLFINALFFFILLFLIFWKRFTFAVIPRKMLLF